MAKTLKKSMKKSMKKPHRKISRQKRRTQKRGGRGIGNRLSDLVNGVNTAPRLLDLQAIIGKMSRLEFRRFKKNMVLLSDEQVLTGSKNNDSRFTEWHTSDEAIATEEAKAAAAKAAKEAAPAKVPAAEAKAGGKWSKKYKRSINCRRPKGFSQRQHCKYGRKSRKSRK